MESALETASEIRDAVSGLAIAAATGEQSAEQIAAVIEHAEARVEAAERTAEQIAEAALESARGREVAELRKDFEKWQTEKMELEARISGLSSQLETLTGQLSALSTIQLSKVAEAFPASSLSTLPVSETVPEAIAEVETLIPESLASVVEENPAAQTPVPAKRKRWI